LSRQLDIFPLDFHERGMLSALRDFLAFNLSITSAIQNFVFPLRKAFDASRRQYHATPLWQSVLEKAPDSPQKLLVITEHDLFIPVLTFVFGEAQLGGRAGIVSVCRLRETFYGLPANPELLFERLCKETVHELGHLYGLHHCYTPGCVMGPSTAVEGVDLKDSTFCPTCLETFVRARDALAARLR